MSRCKALLKEIRDIVFSRDMIDEEKITELWNLLQEAEEQDA